MFDLDIIEEDWKTNSFILSEEDIIEIFRSENVTLNKYEEEIAEYQRKTHVKTQLTAEERLLAAIFGDATIKEIEEHERKLKEKLQSENKYPKKRHLSKESQKKVVEGSLWMVFKETRKWYDFFNGKLSMEKIYYICLESLMNSVRYIVHCEKPVFCLYVLKSIERSITKYVARNSQISYREAWTKIHFTNGLLREDTKEMESLFSRDCYESKEKVTKPSEIFYRLRGKSYSIDYIKNISSDEFIKDYEKVLSNLDELEKRVMEISYDKDGYRGLTNFEIGQYLGIDEKRVSNTKKKAKKILRKNETITTYLP